jgi:hypothetical protein
MPAKKVTNEYSDTNSKYAANEYNDSSAKASKKSVLSNESDQPAKK